MTRSTLLTLVLGFGLATSALAAAPHPTAADQDRDGAYIATIDVDSDGVKNHLDIGVVRSKDLDCDDAHANVSPLLREIVGDGIDNDCSGSDAQYPVADPVVARYRANAGGSWDPLLFIADYYACSAAPECDVDDVAGTMKIGPAYAETHVLADVYVNGTQVFRNHGQKPDGREVVSKAEYSHYRGGSASGGGSGIGRKTATEIATKAATDATGALREEMLRADADADRRLDEIEVGNTGRDAELGRLAGVDDELEAALAKTDAALAGEVKARAEADDDLSGRITTVQTAASNAVTTANSAAAHGPLVEGYVAGNGTFGQPVADGDNVARGPAFGGGGAGVNVGVDGDDFRANVFVETEFGGDGSDRAHVWALGAEYLWQVPDSNVHLGVNAGYSQRSSLVNALETQVQGRLPMAGGTLAVPFGEEGEAEHLVFLARAGVGPEIIGMSGDSVTDDVRLGGRVTVGLGWGIGALKQ